MEKLIIGLLGMIIAISALAEQTTLSSYTRDKTSGEELLGATVFIEGIS